MGSLLTWYPNSSLFIYGLLAPVFLTFVVLLSTYVFTTIRYKLGRRFMASIKGQTTTPIKLPYTIPVLGSAIEFLNTTPGSFWTALLKRHPRSLGSCTLKMGGGNMHILFDENAIQALLKAREPARHGMNLHIAATALGAGIPQSKLYYGMDEPAQEKYSGRTPLAEQEHIWTNWLLRADAVNELTSKFMEVLKDQVSDDLTGDEKTIETGLYSWLRTRLFNASTTALFGSTFLEDYPDLEQDYFKFDTNILTPYFGIPRWMSPKVYKNRDRLHAGMVRWHERNLERNKGEVVDPASVPWEPIQGSRVARARNIYYEKRGLTTHARACLDLGFLFGVSSNAIPATGWMLMHTLDPNADPTLLPRVLKAIDISKRADGSFDINALAGQPLLLSMLHEVFRLYVDVLVTREMPKDLVVPVGSAGNKLLLGKDSIVIAPSWIGHRNDELWTNPGADSFYPERFLTTDPVSGKDVFTMSRAGGMMFPFGGGKTICPGRSFAKQEVLGAVAMVLSEFEFEVMGFVDQKGKKCDTFPGLGDAYPGSTVMNMKGDFKVKIKRRS